MPDPIAHLTTALPAAHAGHWLVWVLYAVPILAVLVALWVSSRRQQGNGNDPDRPSDP